MVSPSHLIDQLEPLHADAFSWAVACCGGEEESAADALQESYSRVASGRAKFGERSSLKTWWFGVIRRTALEQRRGTLRWRRVAEAFGEWTSLLAPNRNENAPADDPLPWCDPDALAGALKGLPLRQSQILALVFQQGLSLSEAAIAMGVSVGSARQHYDRAKKRLRSLLAAPTAQPTCDYVA